MSESEGRLRAATMADGDALHRLNEANVPEVGSVDIDRMQWFIERAPYFRVLDIDGFVAGMLIGLTHEDDDYPSKNYAWFKTKFDRFAYIDRIALDESVRGMGWGPALYRDIEGWAVAGGLPRLCAEVNTLPPNPRSMRFHLRYGFVELDRYRPYGPDAEVAMLNKSGLMPTAA